MAGPAAGGAAWLNGSSSYASDMVGPAWGNEENSAQAWECCLAVGTYIAQSVPARTPRETPPSVRESAAERPSLGRRMGVQDIGLQPSDGGIIIARPIPASNEVPPYCIRETQSSQRTSVNEFPFSVTGRYSARPSKFELCPHLVLSRLTAYAHCSTRNLPKRNFAPRKSGVSMDHNEAPHTLRGEAGRTQERRSGMPRKRHSAPL